MYIATLGKSANMSKEVLGNVMSMEMLSEQFNPLPQSLLAIKPEAKRKPEAMKFLPSLQG
eukprot:6479534-Amphidinium_carterae.2